MTIYPLLKNPDRFVWDFWYWFEKKNSLFHLLYLNADYELVPQNQHHFAARVGYAVTPDFMHIQWIDNDVFCADKNGWDNTAIWSGDVVKCANGYMMFYTSRNQNIDDGLTQYVGMAHSVDFLTWRRTDEFILKSDSRWYETSSRAGDNSIHAWRDPFLFRDNGRTCMLLSAKDRKSQLGQKGAVALLSAKNNTLTDWSVEKPIFSPGWYSECEVPQIYKNRASQKVLVYSCWAKFDKAPSTKGLGGLQAIILGKGKPYVIVPENAGLYACRIIPELNGHVVGFDIKQGGLRRFPIETDLKFLGRDFSEYLIHT
jgi:beta-fructofuranosidase